MWFSWVNALWEDASVQVAICASLSAVALAGAWPIWRAPSAFLLFVVVLTWPTLVEFTLARDRLAVVYAFIGLNAGFVLPVALTAAATIGPRVRRALILTTIAAFGLGVTGAAITGFVDRWQGGLPPVALRYAAGPFLSSMHVAAGLALLAAASLGGLARPSDRHPRVRSALCLMGFLFFTVLLLLTRTRSACLALLGACVAVAITARLTRRGRIAILVCTAAFVTLALAYAPLRSRMAKTVPHDGRTIWQAHPERSETARAAWNQVRHAWWLGVGVEKLREPFHIELSDNPRTEWRVIYCTPLDSARRYGVPATLALHVVMLLAICRGLRNRHALPRAAAAGWLCLWIAGWVIPIFGYWPLRAIGFSLTGLLLLSHTEHPKAAHCAAKPHEQDHPHASQPPT